MPRPKGIQKTGGRKRGTPNRVTSSIKEAIDKFITDNIHTVQADYDNMAPDKRLAFLKDLLVFAIPKHQSVSSQVRFEDLPENVVNQIVDELYSKANNIHTIEDDE